ncbi:MAG: MBL fold metallo-hydrolase [Flavobacteriaceae bacterium]|nr:MBL fold metallo-hydrolase [Flavobacteriaceae bacterium]
MKIKFLGTGTSQGIPVITSQHPVCKSTDLKDKRLRSSIAIQWDENTYIIDCGPDFRQQMLRADINKIDAILFTHEHADHIAGLDEIRPYCNKQQAPLPIYAKKRVLKALARRYDYIFTAKNRYPSAPSVEQNRVKNEPFVLSGLEVIPVKIMHGSLSIFGYRFGEMAYLTDVKTISDREIGKLQNLDVLIINALRQEKHPTHFNLEECLAFIDKIKPKKAYLTHISSLLGFHEEVQKTLPDNVYLAYDALELDV